MKRKNSANSLYKLLSFSLILNFLTDCGKKSKCCSFTLQFIEDGPKLTKKNIAIKKAEYNYTGQTLFEIVYDVLLEWNIDKKLATITVESSNANDQMVGMLRRWLHYPGNRHPFRDEIFYIPCITHVINLLVKDGLDEIDYILRKIRKAIKYMSETAIGKQKLEEVVKKLNLGGKDITSEGVPVSLHQWQESDIVKKMKEAFRWCFDDMSFVYAIVAVFNPRTKLDFVEYSCEQYSGDISEHWRTLSVALGNMFNLYAKFLTSQRSSSSFINNDNSSSSDGDDPSKSQDSPTLWTMARDILAIPMSTSTSNSAFCIETMALDPIFNDLDPDIIEALFCGKYDFHSLRI
ncbi:hypothetical protein SO802_022041 [Lithocarpus litseifolius]|uniref:DUF659 domain-containing protein n=1 Tax=Lithocarpus litseifolius TaxID=425828 RepID=A0AAW2CGN7_9ROSI